MKDGDATDTERSNAHTEMMVPASTADSPPSVEGTTSVVASTNKQPEE